jgi:hypothetical protein
MNNIFIVKIKGYVTKAKARAEVKVKAKVKNKHTP